MLADEGVGWVSVWLERRALRCLKREAILCYYVASINDVDR